ncbi:hypothetical protein [Bradyrhizobium nanningense]|uniref:hypothetical protein n=1 Tax=Bradyrhizobium nanningense TaxID=1325118 RepID=UPI0013E8C812|nr:hypothetical protein [Bradyrhizobium nanningense]
MERRSSGYTAFSLLRSVDYQYGPDGQIIASPPENAIFRDLFLRTLGISIGVTADPAGDRRTRLGEVDLPEGVEWASAE